MKKERTNGDIERKKRIVTITKLIISREYIICLYLAWKRKKENWYRFMKSLQCGTYRWWFSSRKTKFEMFSEIFWNLSVCVLFVWFKILWCRLFVWLVGLKVCVCVLACICDRLKLNNLNWSHFWRWFRWMCNLFGFEDFDF